MKKKSLLILSASLAMALASCTQGGGNEASSSSSGEATSSSQTPVSEDSSSSSSSEAVVYHTVTFDLNGGTLSDGSTTMASQKVQEGRWAKKPTDTPTKANSTFLGWYAAGDSVAFSWYTQIWDDITLIAQYKVNEDQKVTLTLDPNGGSLPAGTSDTVETFVGDRVTLPIPEKDGEVFSGWYYKDSDGNEYSFSGYVGSDIAGNRIYAKWTVQAFNYRFTIKEDGTICINGLLDIETVVVAIPASIDGRAVTEIGEMAFQSRIYLQSVSIPASVTKINPKAFLGAYRINTVTVDSANPAYKAEDNIIFTKDGTELVYFAATKSRTLSTYAIPSGVTKVGPYAFYSTSFVATDSTLNTVTFPEGLVEIGAYAFYEQLAISSLSFPSSLKKIGEKAFLMFDTTVTMKITWSEGLEEIGDSAFSGVYLKGDMVLPNSIKVLGDYCFSRLNALETVVLPASLESFGDGVFFQDYGIETIKFGGGNSHFKVVNDILYSADGTKVYYVPGNWSVKTSEDCLAFASGVTSLESHSISDVRFLTSIDLPDTLIEIKSRAFHYNSTFKGSVAIPDSVTTLGDEAFMNCAITGVTFGAGLTTIGEAAFYDCKKLSKLVIPGNVKTIEREAFMGTSLTSLTLGEGIESIGALAFYYFPASDDEGYTTGSAALTSVVLPDSLKSLGSSAFATNGTNALTSVTFGAGLTEFGNAPFGTASITNMSLSESAKSKFVIDDMALYSSGYEKLYYVSPAKNGTVTIHSGAKEILPYACYYLKNATGLSLPEGLEKIGEAAFASSFKYGSGAVLSLPSSVKNVEKQAFYFANVTLSSATFSEGLESIGDQAFTFAEIASTTVDGSKKYDAITLPNSLKTIGEEAFSSIYTLGTLNLGEGLTSIGDRAFRNCNITSSITLPSTLTYLGEGAFSERNLISEFKSNSSAFTVVDQMIMDSGKTRVYGFATGSEVTSITLPSTVRTIDSYAFSYFASKNAKLVSLTLNDGLKKIGEYAFSNCKFASISIPESATDLGRRLFNGWTSSQTVNFAYSEDAVRKYFDSDLMGSTTVNVKYGTKESL